MEQKERMTSSVAKTCFDAIRAKQSALAAGYDPMVVENQTIYEQLLQRAVDSSSSIENDECETESKQKWKTRARKQTPLVNAGYVSRVLAISYAIRSFVSYHKLVSATTLDTKRRIRIVFLGCGVDAIGLWARSLLSTDDNTLGMTVIEIDKPEVCSIKRKMIETQNMVHNILEHSGQELASKKAAANYYTGTIDPTLSSSKSDEANNSSDNCSNDRGYDYVLIPGDLSETSSLERVIDLDDNNGKEQIPTLVVSELVLSYLPPSSTDALFQWCADRLCRTSDSALVALEPLGFPNRSIKGVLSVEEGYRQDYCQKFQDKMERGRSNNRIQTNIEPQDVFFHPIGSSATAISSRLAKTGFYFATTTNLGIISSAATASASNFQSMENTGSNTLVCPDVFDEHAALILHLQSYILACGISGSTGDAPDLLFRRLMCPWEGRPPDLALMRSGLPRIDFERGIVYHEIEVTDEAAARSLFQNTYGKEYTEEHPAIRKLVKAVLNNDMRETSLGESMENSSAIGNVYRSSGGIFLVASKYSLESSQIRRQVVGCIGIRSYKGKEAATSSTLEIFRLAVTVDHRGQGIGTGLLGLVEAYAREKLSRKQGHPKIKFVANTLTILEDAAKLYEKCGYLSEKEAPLGDKLVLRTYTKEVDRIV